MERSPQNNCDLRRTLTFFSAQKDLFSQWVKQQSEKASALDPRL